MIDNILPSDTYHVLAHFLTKRGSCAVLSVTILPTGERHEFLIWPSQFNDLIEALVGQHHPDTGIANAQLLLDVECRQRKDKTGPYNRIKAFHRPVVLVPIKSDVPPPPPLPEPQDF